jgi:ParB family chromosome partitioning protein
MKSSATATVVTVDPFRCRMWSMHDRLDAHISEGTCRDEIRSFEAYGQRIPVLGRRLRGDPEHDIELIYGARRLFVARHVNKPLTVELREMSDREALIAMDIENRQRADLSPYERGLCYSRWLAEGYFQSQQEIARALKVSQAQVSRMLKLAWLPAPIVEAFGSPLDICEMWGLELLSVLENPARREPTLSRARAIAKSSPRPAAKEIYRELLAASTQGPRIRPAVRDVVVKDLEGSPLFRFRRQTSSVAVILPLDKVSPRVLDSIRHAVAEILGDAAPLKVEPRMKPQAGESTARATLEHRPGNGAAQA